MSTKPGVDEITRINAEMQRKVGNEIAARCYEAGVAQSIVTFLYDENRRESCAGCTLESLGVVIGNAVSEMLCNIDDKQIRLQLMMSLMKTAIEQATGMRVGDSAIIKCDDDDDAQQFAKPGRPN